MAPNISTKRQRATNFSFSEKELLLKYALQNRSVLENKESSFVSWKDKNKCWMQIAQLYNSTTTGAPRDAASLRLKYEGIKKLLRGSKSEIFKTGGGPCTQNYSSSSELEKQLFEVIQLSVHGLPSVLDSDAIEVNYTIEPTEIQNETISDSVDMFDDFSVVLDDNEDLAINKKCVIGENNYLVTDTVVENTVSNQTFNKLSCVPEYSFKNDSLQQPSTSNAVNHKPSWTPIDSTKLLKSTEKHHKLTSANLKRKNNCQTSVSEKFALLADKKLEVVELQKSILTEELLFLKTKHALELKSIELDISVKMQRLSNEKTNEEYQL